MKVFRNDRIGILAIFLTSLVLMIFTIATEDIAAGLVVCLVVFPLIYGLLMKSSLYR